MKICMSCAPLDGDAIRAVIDDVERLPYGALGQIDDLLGPVGARPLHPAALDARRTVTRFPPEEWTAQSVMVTSVSAAGVASAEAA